MKLRSVIVVALIVAGVGVICRADFKKRRAEQMVEATRGEVLLSIKGVPRTNGEFTITYSSAHGCEVRNASLVADGSNEKPNVELKCDRQVFFLAFNGDSRERLPCPRSAPISVKVISGFPGEMVFHNSVCGCEMAVYHVSFLASLVVACLMFLVSAVLLLWRL